MRLARCFAIFGERGEAAPAKPGNLDERVEVLFRYGANEEHAVGIMA